MKARWQFLFIFVNFATVIAVTYAFSKATESRVSHVSIVTRRFESLLGSMSAITSKPQKSVLLIGDSTWEYFLNPLVLDSDLGRHSISSSSYNLSFSGAIGESYAALVKRLASEFGDRHARFAVSVIELNPFSMAKQYHTMTSFREGEVAAIFFNWQMWLDSFWTDPANSAFMLFDQVLRPRDINKLYGKLFVHKKVMRHPPGVVSLWGRPIFMESNAWNPAYRGLSNWNLPASQSEFDNALAQIHEPKNWENMIDTYVRRHDVSSRFSLDRKSFEMYLDAIRVAKKFSDKVYVVMFQCAPSLQRLLDAYMDVNELKRRVREETGVEVLDYSKSFDLTDNDFADAEHPLQITTDRWLSLLAKKIAADHAIRESEISSR